MNGKGRRPLAWASLAVADRIRRELDDVKMGAIVSAARPVRPLRQDYKCPTCGCFRGSKKHRAHMKKTA